jgi:PAS domain S-box-containing protein
VTGEDEVGQLGRAFERMRLSLKGRLEDLSLLLRVSEAVSSNLDLTQGIPVILDGALQATEAHFARLILLDERGEPQIVMARGEGGGYVTSLDRVMARLGRGDKPLAIEDVTDAQGLIRPDLVSPDVRGLIAVSMRSKDHDVGVMWLGYNKVHRFSSTEIDFLSTLASQAAVAVQNSRLFQATEGGRRRLAAILESTNDVVIVTDHSDRVLLLNPAASAVFGADPQTMAGVPITEAIQEDKVIHLLTAPIGDGSPLTDEIPLPDGRTLYASASLIVSGDGQTIGRVAVLRDITYLKELDEMKSEFVATVSHDLRSPLTFMRGYATMIPMVGDMTPKQETYVKKIMIGIEQMTELIDDLLDLGRIEAGVGLMREPCRLDEIIVTLVGSLRARAKAKGLTLRLGHTEDVTMVVGDASLLRRAIANLMDNAIKYTREGGITVGWETRGDRVAISVADTGIGIAKTDHVHLFKKFSRIKRRDTIDIKGSGLGLAIVKSIAERHSGRVWVESGLNQGSTFYIELPVGQPEKV